MVTVVTRQPPISFAPSSVPFFFPWPHRTAGISAAELDRTPARPFPRQIRAFFPSANAARSAQSRACGLMEGFFWARCAVMG